MNSISYQYSTAATSSAIKENKDTVFNTSNKKLNHLRNAKYIVPLCLFNSSSPSFAAMIASSPFLLLLWRICWLFRTAALLFAGTCVSMTIPFPLLSFLLLHPLSSSRARRRSRPWPSAVTAVLLVMMMARWPSLLWATWTRSRPPA